MAKHIFIDRNDAGKVDVRILSGLTDKTKEFGTPEEARDFAESKMGRTGVIVDTTTMSPEKLAEHKARDVRFKAAMRGPGG